MLYTLLIPAHLAAGYATGEVALMTTVAGSCTTLVSSGGAIVGTASLVEAGSVAAGATVVGSGGAASVGAAATAVAGVALGPVLVGVGAVVIVGLGVGIGVKFYRRRRAANRVVPVELVVPVATTASVAEIEGVTPVESAQHPNPAEPTTKPETVEQLVEQAALMAEIEEIVAAEATRTRHGHAR